MQVRHQLMADNLIEVNSSHLYVVFHRPLATFITSLLLVPPLLAPPMLAPPMLVPPLLVPPLLALLLLSPPLLSFLLLAPPLQSCAIYLTYLLLFCLVCLLLQLMGLFVSLLLSALEIPVHPGLIHGTEFAIPRTDVLHATVKHLHSIIKSNFDTSQYMISALRQEISSVVFNMATIFMDLTDTVRQAPPTSTTTDKIDMHQDLFHVKDWIRVYIVAKIVSLEQPYIN